MARRRRRLGSHLRRVGIIIEARLADRTTRHPVRRGWPAQRRRRSAERLARVSAVATLRWLRQFGLTLTQAAAKLELRPSTLASWHRRWRDNRMAVVARGRPALHADREMRRCLLAVFAELGPHIGVPALQQLFPDVARSELAELAGRCRRAWRRAGACLVYSLRWHHPGRVWAIDASQAPSPIDGCFPKILAVRDLASGFCLAALPIEHDTNRNACDLMEALVVCHGAPLVLKSDNGSSFISEEFTRLLNTLAVVHLTSPPVTPSYNGSIEAGIGSLKTRTHYEAARHDHPGYWNCDDLEAGRLQANAVSHPEGPLGLTPDQAWAAATMVSSVERDHFRRVYDEHVLQERSLRSTHGEEVFGARAEASIRRVATGRALIECGYLSVRRRRISPPIVRRRASGIP